MKELSHNEIRLLLQNEAPPDEVLLNQIEAHLLRCDDCQTFANILLQLETQHWSPHRPGSLSAVKRAQMVHNIKSELRKIKMVNRFLNPIKMIAAVATALTNFWVLASSMPPKTGSPASVPIPDFTIEPTIENLNHLRIKTPSPVSESALTEVPVTEVAVVETDREFEPGYQNQTETILVDLDCDGQDETLLTTYRVSTDHLDDGSSPRDYNSVILKTLDQDHCYQTVWEYSFQHPVRCARYGLALFSVSGCEQLFAISGWDSSRGTHQYSARVFQWDGEAVSTVLDVPESLMDLIGKIVISQDEQSVGEAFKLTTFSTGYPDSKRCTCDQIFIDYSWNGEVIVLVDRRVESNQNCDRSGG